MKNALKKIYSKMLSKVFSDINSIEKKQDHYIKNILFEQEQINELLRKSNPGFLKSPKRKITLIFTYYNNIKMLEKQISILEDYSDFIKSNLDLIVVDDCSAQVIKLFSIPGINVSIYRTLKDIPWNQDFCRNLAVSKTKTDWMLISDIDNIIPPETLESLLLKIYDSEIAYRFSRINYGDKKKNTVSPNTWFMTKQLYEKVGGYDERLAGLYGTDFDFRKRVRDAAYIIDLDEVIMPVVESDIPDAATKKYARNPKDMNKIRKIISKRKNAPTKNLTFEWEQLM